MNRSTTLLLAGLLAMTALALPPAGAATATLEVSLVADPAEPVPGTSGSIAITLKNIGDTEATSITSRLRDVDAGVVINKTSSVQLGNLGAGDSTTLTVYTFWVPPETDPGVYLAEFTINYDYDDAGTPESGSLVVGVDFKVRVPKALHLGPLTPDELRPGVPEDLSLRLTNLGGKAITDIQGSWTNPDGVLMPLGQGSEIYLDRLDADAERAVPLQVAAPADAEAGIYAIQFTFSYRDVSGIQTSQTTTFAVHLRTQSMLSVALDEWEDDEVTLSVSNVGLGPANAVEVRILDGPVKVRPAAAVFLGNLDPGDHTTATFSPATTDAGKVGAPLVVEVTYTDPDGVRTASTTELDLGAAPASDGDGDHTALLVGVVVVAVAVGVFVWVRKRKS